MKTSLPPTPGFRRPAPPRVQVLGWLRLLALATVALIAAAPKAGAQGVFSAKNIPAGSILGPDGLTKAPAATTGVQLLYEDQVLVSGHLIVSGVFAFGTITIPDLPPGRVAYITVQVWDTTSGATYDSAWNRVWEVVPVLLGSPGATPPGMSAFTNLILEGCALYQIPQYITNVTASPSQVYAGENALLTATAVADPANPDFAVVDPLPVDFDVVDGPATMYAGLLRPTGSGVVTVVARQLGNACGPAVDNPDNPRFPSYFAPATPVTTVIVVGAARGSSAPISFAPIPELAPGWPPYTLQAAATNGLPVTFSVVSGPGVITNGNQLVVTGTYAQGPVIVEAQATGADSQDSVAFQTTLTGVATQLPQTIQFSPLPASLVYSTNPIILAAQASSGLPVQFSVQGGPGVVSSNRLTFTGTGPVVVEAQQSGGGIYSAATPVTQTLDVAPAVTLDVIPGAGALLSVRASAGAQVQLQSSPDLATWTNAGAATGAGVGTQVQFPLPLPGPGGDHLYWRVIGQ